jgi:hypothetical protein
MMTQRLSQSKRCPHLNPLPQGEADAERLMRVSVTREITQKLPFIAILCFLIIGCESTTNYVPAVTPEMAVGKKEKQVNLATLNKGRTLFVHRCIECHTLPPLWHYTTQDWREIVNSMSHRASLSPAEREAIVAYIIAVRRQSR